MEMIRVSSSAISSIGYDPDTQGMRVRFTSGNTYNFCRVPLDVYERFMKSSSKGTFYNDRVRGRFQC